MTNRKICRHINKFGWNMVKFGSLVFIPCSIMVWSIQRVEPNALPLFAWSLGLVAIVLSFIIYKIDEQNCKQGNKLE